MHTSLKNRTALVTGVSSGIGREIAQLLAERGARVFGTVRNPISPIPGVEIVPMEVTDDASVDEAVHSIVQKAGPIQYLVNNAGYSFMGALEETSVVEARQQFETNLFGVLRVTNAILPGMVETEGTHTAGVIGSDFQQVIVGQTPLGRVGQPDDIAGVAVFLASDDARWLTGERLAASGGFR
jgi:NAD(P)-dependent dehydrogenase (short-subunit alcohol dehydrogenase family)